MTFIQSYQLILYEKGFKRNIVLYENDIGIYCFIVEQKGLKIVLS